jgi:hypothetical protein
MFAVDKDFGDLNIIEKITCNKKIIDTQTTITPDPYYQVVPYNT